ncbi:YitT family protein [Peribacillus frigoritolerans]|uniref:YitT family protein n=1 Tax=Peribacillus frigoritolerans TaxID=450367 RepID=UPI0017840E34|nr:YitT family protein [Peribacillus frigoritolerans]MBD8137556.1 YitT family protein [Bacillus sp. CFBP 13597]MED3836256.1 YitT family protein [Peribacillus frigoritolerans]MED3848570.1 YitT family protein [Peribacillus frigoritolerans]WVN12746.1 YitT family protein [Peribacillus frigoritolerans]
MKKFVTLLFSSFFIGVGLNLFIIPIHLINGGIFGISLLIKYVWGIQVGHTMIMINIPIYLLSLLYDKSYFFNAILGLVFTSTIIDWLTPLNGMVHLPIITSAIIGGMTIGIGVGFMLRQHISPGGVDLLALLISKTTATNPGIIIFIIDSLIVIAGIIILKDLKLMYSLITISCVGFCVIIINSFKTINFLR